MDLSLLKPKSVEQIVDDLLKLNKQQKSENVVKLLKIINNKKDIEKIFKNINIDEKDSYGENALIKAAKNLNLDIIRILVNHGANINIKDKFDDNILNIILENKDFVQKHHNLIINFLIKNSIDVYNKNKWDQTPLMLACNRRNYDIIEILICLGVDVNVKDNEGYTALHYCLNSRMYSYNNKDIILLLNAGSNINIKNKQKITPLMMACSNSKFTDIVEIMLKDCKNRESV